MNILVTGVAGFIGFHLSVRLVNSGFNVFGIDNINDYYDVNLKYSRLKELGIDKDDIKENEIIKSITFKNFKFSKVDLYNYDNLEKVFDNESFDIVVNLAAQAGVRYSLINPFAYTKSNIEGFLNILELSKKFSIKHLIYASSSSVYGLNSKMPLSTKDDCNHPISLYAATKKSNELMAHSYSSIYNLPTTGLRFFTVYGPWGRPDMALFLFVDAIFKNKSMTVYNNGEMIRDFTYVDDITKSIELLVKSPPPSSNNNWNSFKPDPSYSSSPYKIFNIGNSSPVNLNDYINEIENQIGKKALRKNMEIQPGDVLKTHSDVDELYSFIDFKPKTSVAQGIKNFVQWYKKYYRID